MTRKPKKVEFHFDERSQVTDETIYPPDMVKYTRDVEVIREFESNMYRMAGEINQLRARLDSVIETIAKDDPMRRIYDESMPVMVCMWCGAQRQRFELEVKHADDCVWKLASDKK